MECCEHDFEFVGEYKLSDTNSLSQVFECKECYEVVTNKPIGFRITAIEEQE